VADELDKSIDNVLIKIAKSDIAPSMLFHYTNFAGLQGIIESHSLRATYARTLNDSTEQRYGEKLMCRILQEMVRDDVRDRIVTGIKERFNRSFVTCFCTDSNVLSMWRAYALQGGGYCLGFDPTILRRLAWGKDSVFQQWLFAIVYGEPETDLRQSLQELAKCIEQDPARSHGFWVARILASKFKHEAFREEHEWRSIIHNPGFDAISFRERHNYIVPYIDSWQLGLNGKELLPLRKVVCGPTLRNDAELREIVGWMLTKNGYEGVEVETCEIPYRI
jgi:hypothetical protein